MKILMISTFPDERSGITKYTREICSKMLGLDIVHYSLFFEKHPLRDFIKPLFIIFLKKYDIYHIQYTPTSTGPLFNVFMLSKKLFLKKVVLTLHEKPDFYLKKLKFSFFKKIFILNEKFIYNNADHIIVHTEFHKGLIEKDYCVSADKIFVIPHPIYPPMKNINNNVKLVLNKEKRYLTAFGRIVRKKNYEDCIKLLAELPEYYELLIVGEAVDESYYEDLKLLIHDLNLTERVSFLGFLSEEDMAYIMSNTNYCLFLYKSVTQSGALNTALGYKVPVICSEIDEFKEIFRLCKVGILNNEISSIANSVLKEDRDIFLKNLENINDVFEIRKIALRTISAYTF